MESVLVFFVIGTLFICPALSALTDATRSLSTGNGLQYATAGVLAQFTVTVFEENDVRHTSGGDDFIVELAGTRFAQGSVIDNLDGSYFENVWFFYTPVLVAVDPQINHDWVTGMLTPTSTDYVNVRWQGR